MQVIVADVVAAGFPAYIEQTGGGILCIYASRHYDPKPDRAGYPLADGDGFHDVAAGPGWNDYIQKASVLEFYISVDSDDQINDPLHFSADDHPHIDEEDCASIICSRLMNLTTENPVSHVPGPGLECADPTHDHHVDSRERGGQACESDGRMLCNDCREPIYYDRALNGYFHDDPTRRCFLVNGG